MPILVRIRTTHSVLARIFWIISSMFVISHATFAHAADTCIEYPYLTAVSDDENGLLDMYQDIASALDDFPSLEDALDNAAPDLCFSSVMDSALAYLDVDQNRIVISEGMPKGLRNGIFLHELRHLEQYQRGSCPSEKLSMKEYASATFAMEADASAISLLVAWSLKENGHDSVWAALSSWASQSDIATSFAEEMADSGDIALAVTSAFYQWYESSSRLDQYYFAACSDYLDRQDADHILPQYQIIPDAFLEELCMLPDGSNYECSHPEVKSR